jgi:hypothetical protein
MKIRISIISILITCFAVSGSGRTLLTQDEALESAFPKGTRIERQSIFLKPAQLDRIRELSGQDVERELIIRYVGRKGDKVVGYAYFDAHRVRTLPETIMVMIDADGQIGQIAILSFSEPLEYLPKRRWLDQFLGRPLDDELSLNGAIRPISGATLSGRAVTSSSRKILAIHDVVGSDR